jgi:hypothetical protein
MQATSSLPTLPPSTDLLVENLAALWAMDPALAAEFDPLPGREEDAREPSQSGAWTLRRLADDARPVYLHSRYDPVAEAERWAKASLATEPALAFVLGVGLGYGVAAMLRTDERLCLWAFEPDRETLTAALRTVDLSQPLRDGRLRLVTRLDKGKLFADWNPLLAPIHVAHAIATHGPSHSLNPEFFAAARELVGEFIDFGKTAIQTLLVNSRRTCENLAKNTPRYVNADGVGRLKDVAKGKPAVIVSAGPSLQKNKHLLPDAARGSVVIAVQTTFRQVLDLGIEPDFVTSLDYHDISTQFFQHVPPGTKTRLVAEAKASPKVLAAGPGAISLLGNDFLDRLLRELKLDRPKLRAGATVAHLAFYLAEHLGCDPIIFVGQDLGFSDGLAYAPGTSYDALWRPEQNRFNTAEMTHWQRIMRDKPILRRVSDYRGRTTYTEQRLYSYLQQFERDFAQSDRTIIDATEGGVAKRGATPMALADAIGQYCGAPLDRASLAIDADDTATLEAAAASIAARQVEAERMSEISTHTLDALRQLHGAIDGGADANVLIARIDGLRTEMNAFGMTYDLVTQLTPTSELARYVADRRLQVPGLSGAEKQRRQIERDIANVTHLKSAADAFADLMRQTLDEIIVAEQRRAA